jgi:uncharacterized protein
MEHTLLLLITGIAGGMINSIAGGGGIIMFPALLAAGLAPIVASATASLVVLPGSATSAYGYKKELKKVPKNYLWLTIPCLMGAFIGANILIRTDPLKFEKLVPWLVLSAVILLATQSKIHHWLSKQSKKRKIEWHTMPLIYIATFILAIYGGFFGVGFGLMMLALLGFTKLHNVYQMNGLKNLCGISMAIVSIAYFSHAGLINYQAGLVMATGTAIGGLSGAKLAHKVSAHIVHNTTVVIGFIIAIILIIKS